MFDERFLSLASGKRRRELKPLIVAFTDALVRHKFALAGGRPSAFLAAECGVWQGESLVLCARLAQTLGIATQILGLDTFTGLPDLGSRDLKEAPSNAPYRSKRWFADTSRQNVQQRLVDAGVADTVRLVEGLFADTLPMLPDGPYAFVNIDCDLYEGHIECLAHFAPRMMPGGIIYFDDYHSVDFPMAGRAVDDFLKDHPELELVHIRFGSEGANQTKAMLLVP